MFEEEAPRKKMAAYVLGQELAALSLAEIDAYLSALEAEMQRLAVERQKKVAMKSAAQALFSGLDKSI